MSSLFRPLANLDRQEEPTSSDTPPKRRELSQDNPANGSAVGGAEGGAPARGLPVAREVGSPSRKKPREKTTNQTSFRGSSRVKKWIHRVNIFFLCVPVIKTHTNSLHEIYRRREQPAKAVHLSKEIPPQKIASAIREKKIWTRRSHLPPLRRARSAVLEPNRSRAGRLRGVLSRCCISGVRNVTAREAPLRPRVSRTPAPRTTESIPMPSTRRDARADANPPASDRCAPPPPAPRTARTRRDSPNVAVIHPSPPAG